MTAVAAVASGNLNESYTASYRQLRLPLVGAPGSERRAGQDSNLRPED